MYKYQIVWIYQHCLTLKVKYVTRLLPKPNYLVIMAYLQ